MGTTDLQFRCTAQDDKLWRLGLGVGIPPDAVRKAALRLSGAVAGDADPLPELEAKRRKAQRACTVNDVESLRPGPRTAL